MFQLLKNRDFLLSLSIVLGLVAGGGAKWTRDLVIPALAVVMTVSVMGIPGSIFRSPQALIMPTVIGLIFNYGIHGGTVLALSRLFIQEEALRAGFVIVTAVPPAVAVIPFSILLKGDGPFSLIATVGCYLGALILMPVITFGLLGSGYADEGKLVWIMIELILGPLLVSRWLRYSGWSNRVEPYKGTVTNWGFFLVTYTIVGLNRSVFLNQPWSILPVFLVALVAIFLLGFLIEKIGRLLGVDPAKRISLILLGTHKNTGLGAGLALTLFNERTALPATVSTVFMIVYVIWLSLRQRRQHKKNPAANEFAEKFIFHRVFKKVPGFRRKPF
jgi:BASS family bile acid:Na+ symporter